jgi:hypothetical protein
MVWQGESMAPYIFLISLDKSDDRIAPLRETITLHERRGPAGADSISLFPGRR